MVGNIGDVKAQAKAMFVYFSEVLKKEVRDSEGKVLGRIWDIPLKLGEVYPKSSELIIVNGFPGKSYASVPWLSVANMEDDIILNLKDSDIKFGILPKEYEFLMRRDILDQQVVDTFNHKVRRVNDIHL